MRVAPRSTKRSGAAAAEFAIVLPVFVTLVLACVDFGRFGYNYIAVQNSARTAAQYAVMNRYAPSTQPAWITEIRRGASDEMSRQTRFDASAFQMDVTVTTEPRPSDPAYVVRYVRVVTSYPFETLLSWPLLPDRTTLRGQAVMQLAR